MPGIVRIRTISGCADELKRIDPGSQVSKNFIRNLVLSGKIQYTRSGSKYLVNFDSLVHYLNSPDTEEVNETQGYGTLRRVHG